MKTVEDVISRLGPKCRELIESRYLDVLRELLNTSIELNDRDVEVLKVLANPIRLRMVALMLRIAKPLPLCILAEALDIDIQSIIYHVKKLRSVGILREHGYGRLRIVEVDKDVVANAFRKLLILLNLAPR